MIASAGDLVVDSSGRLRLPVAALMLGAILAAALARHFTPVPDGIVAIYAVSYLDGFVRHALLGTLVGPLAEPAAFAQRVGAVGLGMLALNAGLVLVVALRAIRAQPEAGHPLALVLCAAPITVGYFAWDLARPEQAGYVLALALGLVLATTRMPLGWSTGLIAGVTLIGTAAHESFVLVQMPLLLAVALVHPDPAASERRTVLSSAVVAIAGLAASLLILGLGTRDPAIAHAAFERAREIYPTMPLAPFMAHTRDLSAALASAGDALGTPRNVKGLLSAALVLAVAIAVIAWALRRTVSPRDPWARRVEPIAFPLAGIPPVLICAVHPDMTRWLAYAGLNLLVVAGFVLARRAPRPVREGSATPAWIPVLYAVAFLIVLPRWNMFGGIDMPDLLQTFVTDCLFQDPPRMAACTR